MIDFQHLYDINYLKCEALYYIDIMAYNDRVRHELAPEDYDHDMYAAKNAIELVNIAWGILTDD